MIDRSHDLPVVRQCQVLGIARSTAYYTPEPVSPEDLALMRRIDELHLELPFAGSRMLRDLLRHDDHTVGRKRVQTLMKKMGIEAIYRKPNTSQRHAKHAIYPYLLRNRVIDGPNQVWATDITYIPMRRGFVYLCAIIDWYSRRVCLGQRTKLTDENKKANQTGWLSDLRLNLFRLVVLPICFRAIGHQAVGGHSGNPPWRHDWAEFNWKLDIQLSSRAIHEPRDRPQHFENVRLLH